MEYPLEQTVRFQKGAAELFLNGLRLTTRAQNRGMELTTSLFDNYIQTLEQATRETEQMADEGFQTLQDAGRFQQGMAAGGSQPQGQGSRQRPQSTAPQPASYGGQGYREQPPTRPQPQPEFAPPPQPMGQAPPPQQPQGPAAQQPQGPAAQPPREAGYAAEQPQQRGPPTGGATQPASEGPPQEEATTGEPPTESELQQPSPQ